MKEEIDICFFSLVGRSGLPPCREGDPRPMSCWCFGLLGSDALVGKSTCAKHWILSILQFQTEAKLFWLVYGKVMEMYTFPTLLRQRRRENRSRWSQFWREIF